MDLAKTAIAFFFAFIPAMGWLFLYYKKDAKDPEPKKAIAQTFLVGIAMVTPFIFLHHVIEWLNLRPLFLSGISGTIVFALMEEMAKLSAAIFVVTRHRLEFNQLIDGVVYAVTAALGFAFMENLFYLSSFLSSNLHGESFIYVVAFRSLGTMLAHTIFSGLAGLIWAYAYFSKQITPFSKKHLLTFELKDFINHEVLSLHIIRRNILKAHPSRRGGHEKKVLVLEGMVLATFLHVLFNLTTTAELFGRNLTFMAVPGIIGGFLYISYLFTKKLNTKILKVV